MNLATGSMTFGRNHRFVFGSLIAALLAAVILTGVAVWQLAGAGSSATAVEPVAAPAAVPAVEATSRNVPPTYYLVGSEAQAEMIIQADFENQMSYSELGTFTESLRVIDVSTSEGQVTLASLEAGIAEDQLNGGVGANIVDLTAGAGLANAPARSSFVPADVPARSTLYIVASEAEKDALVYEAFAVASFEGIAYEDVAPNVMVVGSPEQELLYNTMVYEQMIVPESTLNIVDLR